MTDYTAEGAVPAEGAAVDDPPTVDEVLEEQAEAYPDQARTSTLQPPSVTDADDEGAGDDDADDDAVDEGAPGA